MITLDRATVDRLASLREDGQTYDEFLTELLNVSETTELSLARGGDG
jgi:hypothetical protein